MKSKTNINRTICFLFFFAFAVRCLLAFHYRGFLSDTACFSGWASRVFSEGFANFYSPDVFSDYPPGYMYILYVLGAINHLLSLEYLSGPSLLLLRLPAILCDMATGYLVYQLAKKHFSQGMALFLSSLYIWNPAVFINSSMWGQVDSVFTLTVILMCLLLSKGKTIPSYYIFALGILLKPQTLVFTPLLLFGIYEHVFRKNFSWEKFFMNLGNGLFAIAGMLFLSMPFGLDKVFQQYTTTLGSYPYISVNAYNFWSLFGLNWSSQNKEILGITYAQLGTLIIVLITVLSLILFLRKVNAPERYYLTGSFLIISMFLFSVRMHERYLFPAMILLLLTYATNRKKAWFYCYLLLSFFHFLNCWHVLNYYDPQNYRAKAAPIILISLFMVIGGIIFYCSILRDGRNINLTGICTPTTPVPSRKPLPFTASDLILMLGITLFYTCFAFYELGNTTAPKTEFSIPYYNYLDLTAENGEDIYALSWYLQNEQDIDFTLETQNTPGEDWTYVQDFTMKSVFSWGSVTLPQPAKSIRITNIKEDAMISELVITNAKGEILPVLYNEYYPSLFDESHTFPETINHLSGCYFDEIYYTRTAYEYIHGLPTYENTHPPFGKILIALSAKLLGTSPFGFRFAGALFGVLMLPFMYLIGRNLTRNRILGAFICFLFAFDFMHFAQTRLTTIDVFVTFFIIVMYYFMECYLNLSFYDTPLKKTWIPLGACGIAFGFGIASKWTGAYAGAGLAILFFANLVLRYREYCYAKQSPKGESNGISHKTIIQSFPKHTAKTILFCILFFVVIPFTIYLLSYLPFVDSFRPGLFERMLKNQETMFSYHSSLTATHPYSSAWYEWPTMIRPIFYYSKILEGNIRQGISSFGNPLIWWVGIPVFLFMFYLAFKKKDKTATFLCIAYLAQFLPWTLVSRCTFIYHYFPSVPFIVMMIGYAFLMLKNTPYFQIHPKKFYVILSIYALVAFVLFLLFYPILSGQPVNSVFVARVLRWFDSWVFVIT